MLHQTHSYANIPVFSFWGKQRHSYHEAKRYSQFMWLSVFCPRKVGTLDGITYTLVQCMTVLALEVRLLRAGHPVLFHQKPI